MTSPGSSRPICTSRVRTRATRRECGHVTAEYIVVTFAMIAALFIPVGESTAGASAVDYVMTSLRDFQNHTTYLLSLP